MKSGLAKVVVENKWFHKVVKKCLGKWPKSGWNLVVATSSKVEAGLHNANAETSAQNSDTNSCPTSASLGATARTSGNINMNENNAQNDHNNANTQTGNQPVVGNTTKEEEDKYKLATRPRP